MSRERKEARRRRGFGDDLFYDTDTSSGRTARASVGDVVTVSVAEVDNLGEGVVRLGGIMISVPGSHFGDRVKIRIETVDGRTGEATILESL